MTIEQIQNLFSKENMIYKITKDVDLQGGTLKIPNGCILDFQGGQFSNGTIIGANTKCLNWRKGFNDTCELFGIFIDDIKNSHISNVYKLRQKHPNLTLSFPISLETENGSLEQIAQYARTWGFDYAQLIIHLTTNDNGDFLIRYQYPDFKYSNKPNETTDYTKWKATLLSQIKACKSITLESFKFHTENTAIDDLTTNFETDTDKKTKLLAWLDKYNEFMDSFLTDFGDYCNLIVILNEEDTLNKTTDVEVLTKLKAICDTVHKHGKKTATNNVSRFSINSEYSDKLDYLYKNAYTDGLLSGPLTTEENITMVANRIAQKYKVGDGITETGCNNTWTSLAAGEASGDTNDKAEDMYCPYLWSQLFTKLCNMTGCLYQANRLSIWWFNNATLNSSEGNSSKYKPLFVNNLLNLLYE